MGIFDKTFCPDCGEKTDGTYLCDKCNHAPSLALHSTEEFQRRLKARMDHPYGCCTRCRRSLPENGECDCLERWERD